MSYITEVLIQGARQVDIDGLNEWLLEVDPRRQQLNKVDISEQAGGTKYFVENMWAAAFNYGPSDLLQKLKSAETWSIYGVKWTWDTEGEFVTLGFYDHGGVATIERERDEY